MSIEQTEAERIAAQNERLAKRTDPERHLANPPPPSTNGVAQPSATGEIFLVSDPTSKTAYPLRNLNNTQLQNFIKEMEGEHSKAIIASTQAIDLAARVGQYIAVAKFEVERRMKILDIALPPTDDKDTSKH